MLEAIARIESYTEGLTPDGFARSHVVQDGVLRQLTVLGEAANRLSPSTRALEPAIPWSDLIGLRNVIVHQYDKIIPERIWRAATEDCPALAPLLSGLLARRDHPEKP